MIRNPRPGEKVWLRYNMRRYPSRYHKLRAHVLVASKGPGPKNALVRCGDELVVVPRGNLFPQSAFLDSAMPVNVDTAGLLPNVR